MVGVNQVIMLSLNMVIIASMIGAGGLGYRRVGGAQALDIGAGLKRACHRRARRRARPLSQAYADQPASPAAPTRGFLSRLLGSAAAVVCPIGLVSAVASYPGLAPALDGAVVGRGGAMDQRPFLRHAGRHQDRPSPQRPHPVQALLLAQPWPASPPCSPSPAGASAERALPFSLRRFRLSIAAQRAVGKGDGDRLSVRHLGHRRLADRHPARHLGGLSERVWRVLAAVIDTLQTLAELRLPDSRSSCCSGSAISPP